MTSVVNKVPIATPAKPKGRTRAKLKAMFIKVPIDATPAMYLCCPVMVKMLEATNWGMASDIAVISMQSTGQAPAKSSPAQ